MQGANHPTPLLPMHQRTTFGIHRPLDTHYRPASCAEVGCDQHRLGWTTQVITGSDDDHLLRRAAAGELDGHRRRHLPPRAEGGFTRFTFPPGQVCLAVSRHTVALDRPPVHIIRGGDHRGSFDVQPVSGEAWINEFGEHQAGLARVANGSPS